MGLVRAAVASQVPTPGTWGTEVLCGCRHTETWAISLALGVHHMKAGLSWREPLDGEAESGPDLLEIDVLDHREAVRAKHLRHFRRLESAHRPFPHLLKLFGTRPLHLPRLF